MNIYLDESGDLGWSFDKPNQEGGSSRHLVIGGFTIAHEEEKHVKRFMTQMHKLFKVNPKIEWKGCNIPEEIASTICHKLSELKMKAPSFNIISIVTRKQGVHEPLRRDANIFYNYTLKLLLLEKLSELKNCTISIDKRTIKVSSGNSFEDYIKSEAWGAGYETEIEVKYLESDTNSHIWLADWISNFIWRNFEQSKSTGFNKLCSYHFFYQTPLFF